MQLIKKLCLLFPVVLLSCQNAQQSYPQAVADTKNSSNQQKVTNTIFKDEIDFSVDDLKAGKTCPSVKSGKFSISHAKAWPTSLVKVMNTELTKLTYWNKIAPKLNGIYLINLPKVFGLTCHLRSSDKYVIFVNLTAISDGRSLTAIDLKNDIANMIVDNTNIQENRGDLLLSTLIHETMHVIDLAFFYDDLLQLLNGQRKTQNGIIRKNFFDMSWSGGSPTEMPVNNFGIDMSSFGLSASSAVGILKSLASESNFISPYAAENFQEDFAVTLESYYMGSHYNFWYHTSVGAPYNYSYSASQLFKSSPSHRTKMCFLAEAALDETCTD